MPFKPPWRDRGGRVAPLKAAVFAALFAPGLLVAWTYAEGGYGPRPAIEINHAAGLWAIRLLLLSLAVTPLRQAWRWAGLIQLRRMIGVAAFAYALLHLLAYVADKRLDLWVVASEIALRVYLTIGFAVLLALAALAATSTDAMLRRLGGKAWRRLHYLAYPAGLLAIVHFFLQAKAGTTEAAVLAGIYLWLMAWRLLARRAAPSPLGLLALTLVVAAATVAGEAGYYGLFTGIDPWRVLQANVAQPGQRPGWIVLFAGLCVAALAAGRALAMPGAAKRPA